jgi:N-dimethylarginine dimethylaminohydrolase
MIGCRFVEPTLMTDAAKLITMARYLARKRIKEHLQARGIRPLEFEPAEITKATDALLECRRAELIREGKVRLCH